MPRTDELHCKLCGQDSLCQLEEVFFERKHPPMFCVCCRHCRKRGSIKGTKKAAIRAWKNEMAAGNMKK